MTSPNISLNMIVAAIACLCTPNQDASPDFAGLQNQTAIKRGRTVEHSQALETRMQNLEYQVMQMKQNQAAMLKLLEQLAGLPSNNFKSKPSVFSGDPCSAVPPGTTQRSAFKLEQNFEVLCSSPGIHNEGWLVIQKRFDGSQNFNRTWQTYRKGFGDLNGEFFIGLEKLHLLTKSHEYELLITLEDFDNEKRFARYDNFAIAGEDEFYALETLGMYTGNAGDSLSPHRGLKFSTPDMDNDTEQSANCAVWFISGWWFGMCLESNLNGQYLLPNEEPKVLAGGIIWKDFRGYQHSMKSAKMAIRRVKK